MRYRPPGELVCRPLDEAICAKLQLRCASRRQINGDITLVDGMGLRVSGITLTPDAHTGKVVFPVRHGLKNELSGFDLVQVDQMKAHRPGFHRLDQSRDIKR